MPDLSAVNFNLTQDPRDHRHDRVLCDESDQDFFWSGKDSFEIVHLDRKPHAEHGNSEKYRSVARCPRKAVTPEECNDGKTDNDDPDIFCKKRADLSHFFSFCFP